MKKRQKIKPGVLCTFKSRQKGTWVLNAKLEKNKALSRWYAPDAEIALSQPFVTALKKDSGLYLGLWVSFTQVMGTNEAKQPVKGWVLSQLLCPVKNS